MRSVSNEVVINGNPISKGIVIGTPFFLTEKKQPIIHTSLDEKDILSEIKRYRQALKKSKLDLKLEIQSLVEEGADVAADILDSHLEMLKDPLLSQMVEQKIYHLKKNTESVIQDVIDEYTNHFEQSKNEDFEGRINDMVDVTKRILNHLINNHHDNGINCASVPPNSIVITHDLVPSALTCHNLIGLITEKGGLTSHTAIIARSKKMAYVSNLSILTISKDVSKVIIDGYTGKVILNPTSETEKLYQEEMLKAKEEVSNYSSVAINHTSDGYPVTISGSISSLEDVEQWNKTASPYISLVRTELLFLSQHKKVPSVEAQQEVYEQILTIAKKRFVTFRLFDLAKDKIFQDLGSPTHHLSLLQEKAVLQGQITALLNACKKGNMRILVPFIADSDEFNEVKAKINEMKASLKIKRKIPIGAMVELPSAAICVDHLAKEADFLSIGTNDLVQYLLANDRSEGGDDWSFHPSLLRIIFRIARAVRKEDKPLSLCGEIGTNSHFIPLLIGLGIKDFSLSPALMPTIAKAIQMTSYKNAKLLANQASLIGSYKKLKIFIAQEFSRIQMLQTQVN